MALPGGASGEEEVDVDRLLGNGGGGASEVVRAGHRGDAGSAAGPHIEISTPSKRNFLDGDAGAARPKTFGTRGGGKPDVPKRVPTFSSSTLEGSPLLAPQARKEEEARAILPTRKYVQAWMVSPLGLQWELLQTLLSVAACVAYVLSTYGLPWPRWVEWTFTILFTIDYFLRWYAAPNRVTYPFGTYAMIDLLCVFPVYFESLLEGDTLSRGLAFLRFVRVLRVMRVLRSFGAVNNSMGAVERGVTMLLLTVASIMFLSAGLIHLAEGDQDPNCVDGPLGAEDECFTFGLALYLVVVTVSTVGYGDVKAETDFGRAIIMMMIVISLVILPKQIDELAKLVALRSRFTKPVKVDINAPHVLITGAVYNAAVLGDLFKAFFHPDRLEGLDDLSHHRRLVVMGRSEPPPDVQALLMDARFDYRVQFVRGAVTSNTDLIRAGAHAAEACMVLTDPHSRNPLDADKQTLLRTLMIKNFRPTLQTLVHILDPGFEDILKQTAASKHDKVVCVDSLKAQLIAQSCLCPGFSTLVLNIVRMSKDIPSAVDGVDDRWLEEYGTGAGREMYTVKTPKCLDGLLFSEVVTCVYHAVHGQAIVWAVQDGYIDPSEEHRKSVAAPTPLGGSLRGKKRGFSMERGQITAAGHLLRVAAKKEADKKDKNKVLLNPGRAYRVRAGQLLLISAVDQMMAQRVEDDDTFATVKIPQKAPGYNAAYGKLSTDGRAVVSPTAAELAEEEAAARSPIGKRPSSGKLGQLHAISMMSRITQSLASRSGTQHHAAVLDRMNREEAKAEQEKYEILQSRILETCNFDDHIVIAGGTFGMDQLLDLVGDSGRKVVMIHPLDPSGVAELEELVLVHHCLYVVRGTASSRTSLRAAAVERCTCFVILSDRSSADDLDGDVLDSSLLFTYLSVDSYRWNHVMSKDFFIMVSTTSRINLSVLDAKARTNREMLEARRTMETPKRLKGHGTSSSGVSMFSTSQRGEGMGRRTSDSDVNVGEIGHMDVSMPAKEGIAVGNAPAESQSYDDPALFLPFFAAGFGFATSTLHTLLAQAFYDSHVFRLVMALMSPPVNEWSTQVTQIDLPEEYDGTEFCDVFLAMLSATGTVIVGIYRAAKTKGNEFPYVYTAPAADARVHKGDRLFVFAQGAQRKRSWVSDAGVADRDAGEGGGGGDDGEVDAWVSEVAGGAGGAGGSGGAAASGRE
mmetsp:Transcript_25090/g.87506  ORF Transcript_25090/g.87506 Transcript_25090/m.87506 type:complete len:1195 (-) Transcript_25090:34-3618(-)